MFFRFISPIANLIRASSQNQIGCLLRSKISPNVKINLNQCFSSKAEIGLAALLKKEISAEKEQLPVVELPKGFKVSSRDGTNITLERLYSDGARLLVTLDLAGSVQGQEDIEEDEAALESTAGSGRDSSGSNHIEQEPQELTARPELIFKLVKPSGRALIYNCTLPPQDFEDLPEGEVSDTVREDIEANHPTFSVDSISVESEKLGDYFVNTDLLDNNLYERFASVLLDRGINRDFQEDLVRFCTAEEQRLYLQFLEEARNVAAE